jgi:hypothetical protein
MFDPFPGLEFADIGHAELKTLGKRGSWRPVALELGQVAMTVRAHEQRGPFVSSGDVVRLEDGAPARDGQAALAQHEPDHLDEVRQR